MDFRGCNPCSIKHWHAKYYWIAGSFWPEFPAEIFTYLTTNIYNNFFLLHFLQTLQYWSSGWFLAPTYLFPSERQKYFFLVIFFFIFYFFSSTIFCMYYLAYYRHFWPIRNFVSSKPINYSVIDLLCWYVFCSSWAFSVGSTFKKLITGK